MSLADQLDETTDFECKYVRTLSLARDAEPDAVAELEQRIESGQYAPTTVATKLTRAGYRVSGSVAQRHANGTCGCA